MLEKAFLPMIVGAIAAMATMTSASTKLVSQSPQGALVMIQQNLTPVLRDDTTDDAQTRALEPMYFLVR